MKLNLSSKRESELISADCCSWQAGRQGREGGSDVPVVFRMNKGRGREKNKSNGNQVKPDSPKSLVTIYNDSFPVTLHAPSPLILQQPTVYCNAGDMSFHSVSTGINGALMG